jgi:SAM-dependent methyltransferase
MDKFGLPESLNGKTVLDVGANNGFFSFLFEKKGAQSVTSIDTASYDGKLPYSFSPRFEQSYRDKFSRELKNYQKFKDIYDVLGLKGANDFLVLADIFGSKVAWKNHSIYNLDQLEQTFDFVFCGALIEHLKNPIEGVEQLCKATREVCIISLSSCIHRFAMNTLLRAAKAIYPRFPIHKLAFYEGNTSGGSFFHFHPLAFKELLTASGFRKVEIYSKFRIQSQLKDNRSMSPHAIFHCYK